MKALHWLQFMNTQRRAHGKTVFSATELANAGNTNMHTLNVDLGRLLRKGVLVRYAHGKYGLPDGVTPEAVVTAVDAEAYVTGAYALYRHGMITQIPREITCFTNRRHNRSRIRTTPLGKLIFVCVGPGIYSHPADSAIAVPEQALCDFIYYLLRRGLRPDSLVTFRNLDAANPSPQLLDRYPASVRKTVAALRHQNIKSL
jgi:hypothetical protein